MNRFRLPFVVAGAVVVLALVALAIGFSSAFQTWAARRVIAGRPDIHASVGSVSAGLKRIELADVRFFEKGAVLTLPAVTIEMPVLAAALGDDVRITRLVAKNWTLELAQPAGVPQSSSAVQTGVNEATHRPSGASPSPVTPPDAVGEAFSGIFAQLRLPVDLSIDSVDLEGRIILPESRGRVDVTMTGGGLAASREGRFEFVARATLTDPSVSAVDVRGTISATMDTPRSFTHLATKLDTSAKGTRFPNGVGLHAEAAVSRVEAGETYSASLISGGQDVITVNAALPRNARAFGGAWKINVRDADVAPFAFGKLIPSFAAEGEGKFDGDAHFRSIHVAGGLTTTVERLEALMPELAAIGELKITADFDLAERDGTIAVEKFEAAVNAAEPVATLRALQPFELNLPRAELRTADVTRELVGLVVHGVPVAWASPLVKDLKLQGGHLRGEFSVATEGEGMTLRSKSPLTIDELTVSHAMKTLVQGVACSVNASADYTPKGWQAELSGLKATMSDATLLTLDAKVGQLSGPGQPLKATGKMRVGLPELLKQPAAAGNIILTSGAATAEFVVSQSGKTEIQADLAISDLATVVESESVKLPAVTTKLRADVDADGKIAFNAPLIIEQTGRKSDLTIVGTVAPEVDRMRAIDATVTSTQLVVEDAQIFAALLPPEPAVAEPVAAPTSAPPELPAPRDTTPPWAGLHGSLALHLQRIIYSDAVQVSNVTGRLRIDAGILKLESLQAGLGETGKAEVNGMVTFDPALPQPYALAADVAIRAFDPGPVFRAMTGEAATIEGKFDVASKLDGRASNLADLASGAGGTFQLTSKGGVFRGLPVNVSHIVENSSKLGAWLASAGTAISAMAGKKDSAEVASKAEAVVELARGLNPIPYDQLSVSVARDAALNTTLRNFTLISPELRLTGSGTALHKPGSCLIEDSLAMEFTLRARGRQGELLKYLGALDPKTDDLGYATCTLPLKVGGTLGRPDTTELNTRLAALALEKSGIGDKAAELLNKIRGGGK